MSTQIAKNIKTYRINNNLSQDQLAKLLNLDRRAISAWETGRSTPSIDTAKRLSVVLNCNITDLIDEDNNSMQFKFNYPFLSSSDARRYLESIPLLDSITKLDLKKMTDSEIIQFANDIIELIRIASKNR